MFPCASLTRTALCSPALGSFRRMGTPEPNRRTCPLGLALLIDFGSTFTKAAAVDLDRARLLAAAAAPTTVDTDISIGLSQALALLEERLGFRPDFNERWACSSAAGGLRIVAIGLVPELTAEAARRAAFGAGARVLATFAYKMDRADEEELIRLNPDLILLAGGTDGGHRDTVLHNARRLAACPVDAPVVVACNKDIAQEVAAIVGEGGRPVRVAPNVMPQLGTIAVEGARAAIRDVFFQRIVKAKGLHRAEKFVDGVIMPTPAAVLEAARLLSRGTGSEAGWGDLMVVDVGGATTDVHSIGDGRPREPGIILKGLPEPVAKRTVEGDLGMRVSAPSLLAAVGTERLQRALRRVAAQLFGEAAGFGVGCRERAGALEDIWSPEAIAERVARLGAETSILPDDEAGLQLDTALARVAVEEAVRRHAGRLHELATPMGLRRFQWGKDLSSVKAVIGTGGVIVHHPRPRIVLEGCCGADLKEDGPGLEASSPHRTSSGEPPEAGKPLMPRDAALWVDARYIMSAAGLLAQRHPDAALALLKTHLQPADGRDEEDQAHARHGDPQ